MGEQRDAEPVGCIERRRMLRLPEAGDAEGRSLQIRISEIECCVR